MEIRAAWRFAAYAAAGIAGLSVVLALQPGSAAPDKTRTTKTVVVSAVTHPARHSGCHAAAPATAAGYAAMFARTPAAQWAGGDTAITVQVGARHVWLFSDSLSTGRFVHSAAIVQTGGCLHVSHAGQQLLPNTRTGWYWITSATVYGRSGLRIKAESVKQTGQGPWDFATGRSRYALATVNAAGDVTFTRWLPGTPTADKPAGTLVRTGPGRVTYGRAVHHDIRIGSSYLVTVCRNWDDGVLHPLRTYAPTFTTGR